jgi:hypothetical protein
MKYSQARSELAVFRTFAEVCPLNIIPESIAKRNPPEPDVFCALADSEEEVGFELVEIIDEGWASLTSGQCREARSLQEAYLASAGEYRLALDERIANALVYVSFVANVQARRRRSAVSEILLHLSTIKPEFCGEWKPLLGTPLHGTVRAIKISRVDFPGPEFDVEAAAAIGDPTLERVRGKCRKSYASAHPIELLAYYELQPQSPKALWLPRLDSFVRENFDASPFRRLWVFDVGSRSISYSFARPSRGAG